MFSKSLPVFGALLLLSSCTQSADRHSASETYILVATNVKIPYWQTAAKGLEQAGADLKVRVKLAGPDKYDPQAQVQEFRKAVAAKPAGILVSPADPELMKPEIDAAIAAGVPVITIDSDSPGSKRLLFIGTNNYQAGLMGGRTLAQHLGGKGQVVVFSIPAQANLEERLRGYKDALAQSPRIDLVQVVDIRGDPELAFDKTIEIVESGAAKVNAFVCLEATAGKEVAEVLNRKKIRDKVVVAMDTDDATLEWIEKGLIAATIGQRPFTMAYYGVKMLDDLHHTALKPLGAQWARNPTSPIPAMIETGATMIDRSNVAEIRKLNTSTSSNARNWLRAYPQAMLVAWAQDDPLVLDPIVRFYAALRAAGHKPEAHIFSSGGHGFGLRKQGTSSDHWIDAFYYWLEAQGLTKPAAK